MKSLESSAKDYQSRINDSAKKTNAGTKVAEITAFVTTREGEYSALKADFDIAYPPDGGSGIGGLVFGSSGDIAEVRALHR